jgi:hypothetical protein
VAIVDAVALLTHHGQAINDMIFVDTCSDLSWTTTLGDLSNVEELEPRTAPMVEGTNVGRPISATHKGIRTNHVGPFSYSELCYYSPEFKFNISSTDAIAEAGISTMVDANDEHKRLFLIPSKSSQHAAKEKVVCQRVGKIWILPSFGAPTSSLLSTAPTSTMIATDSISSSTRDEILSAANDLEYVHDDAEGARQLRLALTGIEVNTDPVVLQDNTQPLPTDPVAPQDQASPPPPSRVDYVRFRSMLGNVSHEETVRLAKKSNVTLSKVDQATLNTNMRIANQSAGPLRKVNPSPFSTSALQVTSDTVGSTFPRSAQGNTTLQTYANLSDGRSDYYAFAGVDHSAATSWDNFTRFCLTSGLSVLSEAINQSITMYTDNGTEYKGVFMANCKRAGIKQSTSTPYKSSSGLQGRAESNNARVQQRMRANLVLAKHNFGLINRDERLYWDYAAQYGSLQDRVRNSVSRGELSYSQMKRELPASFGAQGTVTIQSGSAYARQYSKQLRDRGMTGLLLGVVDHKCIMLLHDGALMITSDVLFDDDVAHNIKTEDESSLRDDRYAMFGDVITPPSQDASAQVSDHVELCNSEGVEPVFVDKHGNLVRVDDKVEVEFTDAGDPVYEGAVTHIDQNNGTFNVHYFDDDREEEHVIDDDSGAVTKSLAVTSTMIPHMSVQQYVNEHGDIRKEFLEGTAALPMMPVLPVYTRATAPRDPNTVAEALASDDAIFWLHAIVKEYTGHVRPERRPPTFHNTVARSQGRPLFAKWVFVRKWSGDKLAKFKGRMVIAAFGLEQGYDFVESYTGCAPISDLRDLEVMALHYSLSVFEIDLTQAYCWMPMPEPPSGVPVIMVPAKGTRIRNDEGCVQNQQLDQALYGHPVSGFALARGVHDLLLRRGGSPAKECPIPFQQSATQPVIFRADFPKGHEFFGEIFWVWIYNDNFRTYTSAPAIQTVFRSWFATVFDITGGEVHLQALEPQQCLGMEIRYEHDKLVSFTMPGFVRKALASADMSTANTVPTPMVPGFTLTEADVPAGDTEEQVVVSKVNVSFRREFSTFKEVTNFYRSLVSSVGWIAKQVAPVLSLAVSILGRAMHAPCWKAFTGIKRVYRYLRGHEDIALTYVKTREYDWRTGDFLEWVFMSDASFAEGKPQGGYTGGPSGTAVTTYSSTKSTRVCTSTFQAESMHAFYACKEIVYKFRLLAFLRVLKPSPIVLYLDNAATVSAAGSLIRKFSPASKHFDIEQKYVVQCVEDGIIKVVHMPGSVDSGQPVPGDGFCVDCMTKPLPSSVLDCYFVEIQGPAKG